ncbi:hypothetical protein Pdw03_7966 [Penicillium digitatum]|uniref:Uncharacterized protein n=1 Tax=Penicillium digitatum TaxID=36651 RepID=A0A7T6XN15_PENDI|nr:hypothetical protein Pdw03_7966 [Penicillium digitatum]
MNTELGRRVKYREIFKFQYPGCTDWLALISLALTLGSIFLFPFHRVEIFHSPPISTEFKAIISFGEEVSLLFVCLNLLFIIRRYWVLGSPKPTHTLFSLD